MATGFSFGAGMTDNASRPPPWGDAEKAAWRERQSVQRSYADLVLQRLHALPASLEVTRYGALSYDPARYPLYLVTHRDWTEEKPTVLVTGGVHGYETSGVLGALAFLETAAAGFAQRFNIVCAPCVSPWGFETINRWNPLTIDPNRAFHADSPAEECAALMAALAALDTPLLVHIDLHETTDTDNTVFRPERAARDGVEEALWEIPDGFYTVGDTGNPQPEFQAAIIAAVRRETHIAQADAGGRLIGVPIAQEGVIHYDVKGLNLCTGFTDATYCTTTEVYPDSPRTTPEEC
ncbi:MAG: M14 family metallocarboxypeptidase, partial [Xanthomonadales bacterium]|nr:M14 family metallocarboxypeptidase [Xanthomonadales bacterium]